MHIKTNKIITVWLLMAFLLAQFCADFAYNPRAIEELRELVQVEMIQYNAPGIMVTVVQDGKALMSVAYGYSDIEAQRSMELEATLIQTGSISKTFTSYMLLSAITESGIDENSAISKFLDDSLQNKFSELTFKNVFLHTTGLPSVRANTAINHKPSLNPDAIRVISSFSEEAKRFLSTHRFNSVVAPGGYSIYANVNSVLAGILIEKISGKSYEGYTASILRRHFDMNDTARVLERKKIENAEYMTGYYVFGGTKTRASGYQAKLIASDDLVTTTVDMEKFLIGMTSSLDAVTRQKMLTRQIRNDALSSGRSYGFSITNIHGHEVYFQDGGTPGTHSRLFLIPDEKFGVFITYNSDNSGLRESLSRKIIEAYLGNKDVVSKSIETSSNDLVFIGAFAPVNVPGDTVEKFTQIIHQVRVSQRDDGIYIGKDKYIPYSGMRYYSEETGKYATFKVDENARLEYLIIDNAMYKKAGFFQSLIVEMTFLILTLVFNLLSILVILNKWNDMKFNRVQTTPRNIVLAATVLTFVLIGLIIFTGLNYSVWAVIFNSMPVLSWIKLFGFSAVILIIPYWSMLKKVGDDFRWTGAMLFVFRVQGILNICLISWLWRYNLL